jgi:Phage phiEco32-like COOH.NH2 ligase-type 2
MKYQEQHEAFKRLAIQHGIGRLEQLNKALPFGCAVSPGRLDRWFNGLLEPPGEFCSQRRYVNRFKLGADPEFIFATPMVGPHVPVRVDARNLGLAQGLAFGMDNNGRLTEIRPYPSRSALTVVASILSTLRWMVAIHPETVSYEWIAGAFLFGDGLGGHVHFGRKRPGRELEVKALDALDDELMAVQAYPAKEVALRRAGDQHHQLYGHHGDIRKQIHGYEYRTFPSWLDSPELAFLTLTLSKLVVQNPALAQGYMPLIGMDRHYQRLRNLLAYYKDVDDDARLALQMLLKKFPVHVGGDFRKRWGIDVHPLAMPTFPTVKFVPSSIKPTPAEVTELFDYFLGKRTLSYRVPMPTWGPLVPPEGYDMTISRTQTYGAKGLGELLWDVCCHQKCPYNLTNIKEMRKGAFFSIPLKFANTLPRGWQKFCGYKVVTHSSPAEYIYSYEKSREPLTFMECRRLLLETVFPFWRISEVKSDSWQQWQQTLSPKKSHTRYRDRLIYGEVENLPVRGE